MRPGDRGARRRAGHDRYGRVGVGDDVAGPVQGDALSVTLGTDGRVWLVWGVEETLCPTTRDG